MSEPSLETKVKPVVTLKKGRTVGIVGVLTVFVAIVGYLREASLAARFGISSTMDAYFAAVFIPTILYLVLIAGTLSPVLIPILMQEKPDEEPASASASFSVITNFALLVLVFLVSCGLIGTRVWLPVLFPGFDRPTAELAVRLVYIIFPALPFLAVSGILTALLNGFHKFRLAAFAPAVSSICVIGAALWFHGERAIYWVGMATALGFLLQALILLRATAALGVRYRPILDFRHPAIKKLLRLGVPLFLYLVVANAASVFERNLASRISAGSVSTLTYALRLFTAPSNFLAAPLAIVAYPGFAREAVRSQRGELAAQTSRLFRLVIFLFLPVTICMILNANAITRLLYQHGKFSAADSWITARVLAIYSVAIVPNAVAVVLLRCYYAIEDMVTPLLAEVVDLAFFLGMATLLMGRFGLEGLATARTMTFFLVMAILVVVLAKKGLLAFSALAPFLLKTCAATLAMAVVNWVLWLALRPSFESAGTVTRLGMVALMLALAAGAFLGSAVLLRLNEAQQVIATVSDLARGNSSSSRV